MSDFPLHRRSRLKRFEISEESTPNYLFGMWLKEWYEEAASRDSKLQFAYRKVSLNPRVSFLRLFRRWMP